MEYIIYHQVKEGKDCPDGIAAAWVAAKVYPNAEVVGWTYDAEPPTFFEPGDRVIIVDFSFRASALEEWAWHDIDVILIDHHAPKFPTLEGVSDRVLKVLDKDESGATLTWKHFFQDKPMPEFLRYVRDRDLWIKELPETEIVHEGVGLLGRTFELFDKLEPLTQDELIAKLRPIAEPHLKEKRDRCEELANQWSLESVGGYWVPVVELSLKDGRLTSDTCAVMYGEKFGGLNLPILYKLGGIKSILTWLCRSRLFNPPFVAVRIEDLLGWGYSLRSDQKGNNFDVSAIAEQYEGGGHRNAAGFRV